MRRFRGTLAGVAWLGAAACDAASARDVEPLPPLQRPTPEQRAGLPVLSGRWLFTGFEYAARDTLRVRELVYRLVPPGELRLTQRLDSIAGQYVRGGSAFPLTGEVRRDGIFTFVVLDPAGAGTFAAGHVVKDTVWMELTSFPSAAGWPPETRAAFVQRPRGAPFTRLRGYVPPPPPPPVDSSLARPAPAPAAPPPAPVTPRPTPAPPPFEPAPPNVEPLPAADTPPAPAPQDTPRRPPPRRRPQPRDTVRVTPPPAPPPAPEAPPPPRRDAPRDTIRFPPGR